MKVYNPAGAVLTQHALNLFTTMKNTPARFLALAALVSATACELRAWDYEGHRLINQLALDTLPANFPAFAKLSAARERIGFLAGEADRWRNTPELPLRHCNGPDHYFDLDLLAPAGLTASQLSPFRYEFVVQFEKGRAANAQNFPAIDPNKDSDKTKSLIGFLPWTIVEHQAKLKSAFSYLKEYELAGTPEEITNARENIIHIMGAMGHFLGDATQPLHTTKHHHGWIGANPKAYATNYGIHSWIDGGYIQQFGVDADKLRPKLRPAAPITGPSANFFPTVVNFLHDQFKQVEPLYELEKAGKLSGRRELSQEGHDFITSQMLRASQMLGDLWLTAWQQAPPDMFLRSALEKRKATREAAGQRK